MSPVQEFPQFMATQFEMPSQIDPDVLATLPEDIRARLVSRNPVSAARHENPMSRETSPFVPEHARQTSIKSAMKITPKKKRPSPRKIKHVDMIGQTRLPLAPTDSDFDASVLAELPTQIREEIISHSHRERALAQASEMRHLAWAAEKAVRERKVNRTISIPEPAPKPTFQKMSELPELRNLISLWFEELRDEGPADEDVILLGSYLKKVVLVEKDLRKAEALVNWFLYCCKEQGRAMDEWWDAGQNLGKLVNEACSERGLGSINFDDTRNL
jgi:DNA repair protein REV1